MKLLTWLLLVQFCRSALILSSESDILVDNHKKILVPVFFFRISFSTRVSVSVCHSQIVYSTAALFGTKRNQYSLLIRTKILFE